jgi:hypothetical protein
MGREKIRNQLPIMEYTFLICHFSLAEAVMNVPRLCKLPKTFTAMRCVTYAQ